MPRAKYEYTTRAGYSVYPIRAGRVFRVLKTRMRYNNKVGMKIEHDVYLWVLSLGLVPSRRPPKERKVYIITALVPRLEAFKDKILASRTNVQFEYVVRMLSTGYEIVKNEAGVDVEVKFSYKPEAYKKFWKAIGVIHEHSGAACSVESGGEKLPPGF